MLDKKLQQYSKLNIYPFHMPGHKRMLDGPGYDIDITEIEGFDDLHHPTDILAEAQERAAKLYGAESAYYLVNGSTCGLLAAISAAAPKKSKVIVARNCHKAVYHAMYLRELCPVFVYPRITKVGIQGHISYNDILETVKENPDAKTIVITSPTYDGVVSDVKRIADLAHKMGMSLIVDEAHGAHFGLTEKFSPNAISLGADAVIVSVHKTLPAYTQTALLLLSGDNISKDKVEMYLDIYETSSPSYILMGGIERCVRILEEKKESLFNELWTNLEWFYDEISELKNLKVIMPGYITQEVFDFDPSKIIILSGRTGLSGYDISQILLNKYEIQLEMAAPNYALALSTIMDNRDGFIRLSTALKEMDKFYSQSHDIIGWNSGKLYTPKTKSVEIYEALEINDTKPSYLSEAVGKVCGDYIYLYPPGIPIVVPGEIIDKKLVSDIEKAESLGFEVYGIDDYDRIKIVNFS